MKAPSFLVTAIYVKLGQFSVEKPLIQKKVTLYVPFNNLKKLKEKGFKYYICLSLVVWIFLWKGSNYQSSPQITITVLILNQKYTNLHNVCIHFKVRSKITYKTNSEENSKRKVHNQMATSKAQTHQPNG